jgi:predicted CoA-binding protein
MELQPAVPQAALGILQARRQEDYIVLVGASNDPGKYGNIILKDLVAKGYSVVPVNPRDPLVEGIRAYPSVERVPGRVAIVNLVVRPEASRKTLEALVGRQVDVVWFQPGSSDADVVAYAREHFRSVVVDACIMVVSNRFR